MTAAICETDGSHKSCCLSDDYFWRKGGAAIEIISRFNLNNYFLMIHLFSSLLCESSSVVELHGCVSYYCVRLSSLSMRPLAQ